MESDIFIIGGGINGTGIAADAAGRGLSVTLCEKHDLASGTSSCSTKLIHGGLRYLENYEFKLVKKALQEREILIKKAPHLISPLKFILPYEKQLRPAWLIRLGLFLYDHLSSRSIIPGSSSLKFTHHNNLKDQFKKGFSYYDCFTDDSRLVIENALAAKEKNARVLTRTEFVSAHRENNAWKIHLTNLTTNERIVCYAKTLINAAGPWIHHINQKIRGHENSIAIELVKGSHIVIPKLYSEDFAYILQNADKRIIFTIPYQQHFTLIGTTDIKINDINHHHIQPDEINYLCESINYYFKKTITATDIKWSFSGVRCLQNQHSNNPSETTRDYKLLLASEKNALPLLTVIGGKLTTFRHLAEDALNMLKPFFPHMGSPWTATQPLPGGDIPQKDFDLFYKAMQHTYHWLPHETVYRYAKNYGTRIHLLLNNTNSIADMGNDFGAGLYQKEVDFLLQHEWATCVEDIVWRRTKLGLFFTDVQIDALRLYISSIVS